MTLEDKVKNYIGVPEGADKNFFANEVCAALLMLMALGGLDIPQEEKEWIADPFEIWMEFREEEMNANRSTTQRKR